VAPKKFYVFLMWISALIEFIEPVTEIGGTLRQSGNVSKTDNSLPARKDAQFSHGRRSYQQARRVLNKAAAELTILDTLPD
jgi:hypothetical protein